MLALTAEDFTDLRRWLIAGVIVALTHGGLVMATVRWHEPVVFSSEPAGAIVVEFAPVQVAAPEQVQQDAVPEKPIEKVEKEPEEKVADKGELPIEQKVEPKPREEQPRDAVAVTTPPTEQPSTAPRPAGPLQGTPTKPVDPKAMQTWVGQIAAAIERKKRHYQFRQGTVAEVTFTLDQQGRLIDSRITKSSGAADLDAEALALLKRTQPFPPASAYGINGEQHLTVPIRFSLK
jgi:protein TonB